jgi:hypothetical protein
MVFARNVVIIRSVLSVNKGKQVKNIGDINTIGIYTTVSKH